jgi:hypothetical protein
VTDLSPASGAIFQSAILLVLHAAFRMNWCQIREYLRQISGASQHNVDVNWTLLVSPAETCTSGGGRLSSCPGCLTLGIRTSTPATPL